MVPAGARISAGKFGRVARSFPKAALTSVNRSPASCMPSPESPANRMTTRSSVSGPRVEVVSVVTFLPLPPHRRGGVGISPLHHHTFGLWMVRNGARVGPADHPFVARSLRLVEAVELAIDPSQQRGEAAAVPRRSQGLGLEVGPRSAPAGRGAEEAAPNPSDDEHRVVGRERLEPCRRVPHGDGHRRVATVAGAGPDGERGDAATGLERADIGRSRDRAAQHAEVDGFHRSPFGSEPGGGSAGSRLGGTYRGGRTTTPAAFLPFSRYPVKRGASTTAAAGSTGGSQLLVTVTG